MTAVKEAEAHIDDKQLATGNEFLHPMTPYGPNKLLKEMTRRILILDKSKTPLQNTEAGHVAQLALSTGLNPFAGELYAWIVVKKDGRREFNWMPGYKGIVRQANEQAKEEGIKLSKSEPEVLTDNEKRARNIPLEDMAVKIVVRDDAEMKSYSETLKVMADAIGAEKAYADLGPPPGTAGYGVVTKEEIAELDKYSKNKMPHINRAAKRALTQAYKFKMNLQFGGTTSGEITDYSEYVKGDTIEAEFEDVTDSRPAGYPPETFGEPKERMNPKFWKGICEQMVDEELAMDAFVAAELLAYSQFTPRELNETWALKYFNHAKDILADDESLEIKDIAPVAYARLFETGKQKDAKAKEKKTPAKKDDAKKKPATDTKKKEEPVHVDEAGLTKTELESYKAMSEEFPRYTPKTSQDWATAKKYIDLKKVATSWDEFRKIVETLGGDCRKGMMRLLGYL